MKAEISVNKIVVGDAIVFEGTITIKKGETLKEFSKRINNIVNYKK